VSQTLRAEFAPSVWPGCADRCFRTKMISASAQSGAGGLFLVIVESTAGLYSELEPNFTPQKSCPDIYGKIVRNGVDSLTASLFNRGCRVPCSERHNPRVRPSEKGSAPTIAPRRPTLNSPPRFTGSCFRSWKVSRGHCTVQFLSGSVSDLVHTRSAPRFLLSTRGGRDARKRSKKPFLNVSPTSRPQVAHKEALGLK
jgi:hypothetical protein